jgi:hypothetical protein
MFGFLDPARANDCQGVLVSCGKQERKVVPGSVPTTTFMVVHELGIGRVVVSASTRLSVERE